jgi:hypothetical protein
VTKSTKSGIYFFGGEILPNFDLKNMNPPIQRIFHGKNGPNSPDFKKKQFPNPPGFEEQKVS